MSKRDFINIHWMKKDTLIDLMYDNKIYAQGLFKPDGFKQLMSHADLNFAIKNKNVWGLKNEVT